VFFVSFVVKNMKTIAETLSISFALLLLTGFERACAGTVDVLLHEQALAKSPVIRLGDVARIVTADRQRARQLSSLLLMPAPAPGTQRFLRKREVEDLLTAHGEDISQLRIDGAVQVAINTPDGSAGRDVVPATASHAARSMNRHAAILAGHEEPIGNPQSANAASNDLRRELRRIISNYIDARTGQAGGWRVTCDVPARHLAKLDSASSPPACSGGAAPWTGRQQFLISFQTAEGAVQFPVYTEIAPPIAPVVVALQPIARGAVITASDVELQALESVPTAASRRAPVTSIEQLIGMEARQPIAAGDVIFTDKVQDPVLVKRGEMIKVVSETGNIRVTTEARARQDGSRGELIQLESLETREMYDARVTGYREAAVFTAMSSIGPTPQYSPAPTPLPTTPPSGKRIETARRTSANPE
jgi:flagella basal body P-ring formation protein FlgA